VPYAYGQDRHLAINIFMNKNTKKNDALVKLFVDVFVVALCVLVMIVGGIMVTGNAAGQLSAAMQLPMEVYYVCVPISGCLMVIYGIDKIVKHIKDFRAELHNENASKQEEAPSFKKAV
nr:TRAP transporter small permease [Lachnospira sp.]